ncbi:hypothetical protein BUALT_Bualt07G0057300 [Buddleja alternifolia]|uniref:NAC domain-containing protein n=1 Tax=Buddleja alternifolia TaxID=168488 RepID=A0AAV6XF56_9LAMI|nr:hypothetical protein BUALT_Bualt07G0057300 [Buddleja alternifolia]
MTTVMVPEGFRFVPTEEELISSYLLKKAMGLPLPSKHILEKDLYGEKASPWDVLSDVSKAYWDLHVPVNHDDEKEIKKVKKTIYVFTRLKRVNGRRGNARSAGCGTWKGQTVGRKICKGSTREEIGLMKMFTFIPNNKAGLIKDHWNMHEYSLSGVSLSCDEVKNNKDYVICRITREIILKKEKKILCQTQERQPIPPGLDNAVRYSNNQLLQEDNELGKKSTHVQTEDILDCNFDIDELLTLLQENDQQERQPISPCLDLVRYSDNQLMQEENELGKKRSFEKEDEILSCNKKQKRSSSFEELGYNKSNIDSTTDHIVTTWEELGSIAPVESSRNNDFNISVDDYEDGDGYFCDFDQLEDGDGNSIN